MTTGPKFSVQPIAKQFGERGGVSPPVYSPQDRGAHAAPLAGQIKNAENR